MLELIASSLRMSTPLIFAGIGGMYSERSGVVNIALEGKMLIGAFVAAWGTLTFHSPWIGLLCAMFSGVLSGTLHALLCIKFRADQIVAGTALNLLAAGLTPLLCKVAYNATGSSPNIPMAERFGNLNVPFFSDIPVLGPLLFQQNIMVYLGILLVLITWFVTTKTRFGLWIQAVGDHPDACFTAGISVIKTRFASVIIAGVIAAMGGAFLSIAHGSGFTRNMTSGRGFMALAALIFGKWKPIPTLVAALLFGFADALQIRIQGSHFNGVEIPVQFIQILPYLITILVLAGFIGSVKAPLTIGQPWESK